MKGAHIGQLDVKETSTGYWNKGDRIIWSRNSSVVSKTGYSLVELVASVALSNEVWR